MNKVVRLSTCTLLQGACITFVGGTGWAQSSPSETLEQSYARLCDSGQQTEACDALRRAMLEKLSARREAAKPAFNVSALATEIQQKGQEHLSKRWGTYAQMAGATWIRDNGSGVKSSNTYEWVEPGVVLGMTNAAASQGSRIITGKFLFRLRPNSNIIDHDMPGFAPHEVQEDGSVVIITADNYRTILRADGGTVVAIMEKMTSSGRWKPNGIGKYTRTSFEGGGSFLAQAAKPKERGSSSGGGFLKVLQGAVGGLQGMADAGAGMSEALVGAAIGAASGAAGIDAASISQSMYEGTAKVKADNDKLREIMETGTADALARGTAEYNRRQAAAGNPVQIASNSASGAGSSGGRTTASTSLPQIPASSARQSPPYHVFCRSMIIRNPGTPNVTKNYYVSAIGTVSQSYYSQIRLASECRQSLESSHGIQFKTANGENVSIHEKNTSEEAEQDRDLFIAQARREGAQIVEVSWAPK